MAWHGKNAPASQGQTGLDHHQVRLWYSFHRHTVLSISALAVLAVTAARPAPGGIPASAAAQLADWADNSILPADADKTPAEIGMVKVSVPEARRLLRLATMPMSSAARQLGYAWSAWRRKDQARAAGTTTRHGSAPPRHEP